MEALPRALGSQRRNYKRGKKSGDSKEGVSKRHGGMEMTFQMVSGAWVKEVKLEPAWYAWEF